MDSSPKSRHSFFASFFIGLNVQGPVVLICKTHGSLAELGHVYLTLKAKPYLNSSLMLSRSNKRAKKGIAYLKNVLILIFLEVQYKQICHGHFFKLLPGEEEVF